MVRPTFEFLFTLAEGIQRHFLANKFAFTSDYEFKDNSLSILAINCENKFKVLYIPMNRILVSGYTDENFEEFIKLLG